MTIIDCHCHAGQGDGFRGPWDSDAPLEQFLEWSNEAGIARTVLFPAFHSDYSTANRLVASIVRKSPDRFWGFAFVHPERDRGRIASMVGEAVERHGFRGIKVHRSDARITREVCDAARRFRIPVLYDVVGEVESVELFAPLFRDVDFIIPHLGSFADDWRAQHLMADHAARHPNVYADTSGVRRFELLETAVKRAGARKILFGTDGPWLHPGLELMKVRLLGLAPADEGLVLGGNLLRILREPSPPPPSPPPPPTLARETAVPNGAMASPRSR